MATSYESVLHEVELLAPEDQARLIAEVADRLKSSGPRKSRVSILELRGLGKEIWQGIDAQEYVNKERDSWDG